MMTDGRTDGRGGRGWRRKNDFWTGQDRTGYRISEWRGHGQCRREEYGRPINIIKECHEFPFLLHSGDGVSIASECIWFVEPRRVVGMVCELGDATANPCQSLILLLLLSQFIILGSLYNSRGLLCSCAASLWSAKLSGWGIKNVRTFWIEWMTVELTFLTEAKVVAEGQRRRSRSRSKSGIQQWEI